LLTRTVLHITDPHLLAQPGQILHGWRVHDAFETVLSTALAATPEADALVLGGDLVDDASVAGYRWLNTRLTHIAIPVLAVAGNHEAPDIMQRELSCAVVHGQIELNEWRLLGLNSHVAGSAAGQLGKTQLAALSQTLAADSRPTVLFVHHPGWSIGSPWQDAIGLHDRDALAGIIAKAPNVRALACGHAHQAQSVTLANEATGTLTASTMRQFAPGANSFAEAPEHAPGYRVLKLNNDATVSSIHHRVEAARCAYVGPEAS